MNGTKVCVVTAKVFDQEINDVKVGKLGVLLADLKGPAERAELTKVAQFATLVCDGLILTKHIFEGLNRPLYRDGKSNGDDDGLIYSRRPTKDVEWHGGKDGGAVKIDAPAGCVFVAYVSPNVRHKEAYPEIDGWINHWCWVREDKGLDGSPTQWVDRFNKKLWTWN